MRQSNLFFKTQKDFPKDEVAINAQYLIRAGFVYKEMAGVFSYLPLGLRVIKKIEKIIREEMDAIGGVEMKTSVLQSKEVWEKTDRWNDKVVDNWFKTKLKGGGEAGLSFTNEEAYANILKQHISSYKNLPAYPYDFKEIFRNEARSKSGILRGREFYWKALYSFSKSEEEHNDFYEKAKQAYRNVFQRVGIGHLTYLTFASGGSFSKFSHEFQTVTESGEDAIYLDEEKGFAVNKEIYNDEVLKSLDLEKRRLKEKRAIEVGNIFSLGTRFSEPFNLTYKDEKGKEHLVIMGSYGIGLSRLMGTIVEVHHDEKGMIWPVAVAPYIAHLLLIGEADSALQKFSDRVYDELISKGVEVLFDDRPGVSAGEKFADADLIGIPWRVIISEKTMAQDKVEIKKRDLKDSKLVKVGEFVKMLNK